MSTEGLNKLPLSARKLVESFTRQIEQLRSADVFFVPISGVLSAALAYILKQPENHDLVLTTGIDHRLGFALTPQNSGEEDWTGVEEDLNNLASGNSEDPYCLPCTMPIGTVEILLAKYPGLKLNADGNGDLFIERR